MIRFLCLAACVVGVSVAGASPPSVVEVPRDKPGEWHEVRVAPGRLLVLGAEPASRWLLVDEDGADLRAFESGKLAAFASPIPGRWKVVVTGPDGTPARVVVVVGEVPPGPPGPPAPKPPEPKPPVDPLRQKLKDAYDSDPHPQKSEQARDLAALYREAAKLARSPEVRTSGELLQRVRSAASTLIGPETLKGVRKAVADELGHLLPVDAELTEPQRTRVAELFQKLSQILDSLAQ